MQLEKGVYCYSFKVEDVFAAHLKLNGALNNDYADNYPMAALLLDNMKARYTEGMEGYNPQNGMPIYWMFEKEVLWVWPVPENDIEIILTVKPRASLVRRLFRRTNPVVEM
jgi:hypothetical protein